MNSEVHTFTKMTGDRRQSTDEIRCPSSGYCHLKVGFPIRKSADQSSFAAPRGLSQRSTSFIASQRQGIHQMPLRHLIALIINAHPSSVSRRNPRRIPSTRLCNGRWPATHVRSERSPLHDVRQHAHADVAWTRRIACANSFLRTSWQGFAELRAKSGGARRNRTDDLLLAKQALSQLSYGPALRHQRSGNGGPG